MNRISNFIRKFGPDKGFGSVIGANTFSSIIGSIFWIYLATLLSTEDYGGNDPAFEFSPLLAGGNLSM